MELSSQLKNKLGRPKKLTRTLLQKMEEVFAMGGTDEESCFYAGISPQTLYNYQRENPDYLERKRLLKMRPILKARKSIYDSLDNPEIAKWYLARKIREEFMESTFAKEEKPKETLAELVEKASPEIKQAFLEAYKELLREKTQREFAVMKEKNVV